MADAHGQRRPIRLALVGAGAAAREHFLPALADAPQFELTAVVDPVREHALAVAERHTPAPTVAVDLADALDGFDAAVLCAPADTHTGIAETLLTAGKHVLVDSPLAPGVADCARLTEAAERGGAVLLPVRARMRYPSTPWVAEVLAAGRLGAVHTVLWREGAPYSWPVLGEHPFAARTEGGGLLAELGGEVFDVLASWFGAAEVIEHADNSESGSDSELRSTLRLGGSVTATVELSRLRGLRSRIEVHGDVGTLVVGCDPVAEFRILGAEGSVVDSGAVPGPAEVYRALLADFADAIAGRGEPAADVAAATAAVRVVAECREAVRAGALERPWRWPSTPESVPEGRVAVTGAGGGIGAVVCERAATAGGRARAVLRDRAKFARLSHVDAKLLDHAVADLADPESLAAAFTGCDTVVHAAVGNTGDVQRDWVTTVDGTGAVLRAAARAGVRRVVHVGTVLSYDTTGVDVLTEDVPRITVSADDRGYPAQKVAAERLAFEVGRETGVEVVCLQPAYVYGPWCPSWTLGPIGRLGGGATGLPSGDVGVCNAVHVVDVADALLHAATDRVPAGACLLVAAAEPTTWGGLYDAYRDLLGVPRPEPGFDPAALVEVERGLYEERTVVDVGGFAEFGWRPAIGFAEGIAHTQHWARWALGG